MSDESLFNKVYNPDVLTCLANLSNDEVFTPPEVANKMLDLLPQELFSNPDTTFLDPACKSGVFLREIAKRLIKGLERQMPDLEMRLEHIYKHQLFGIAITELTSLLSRRSLYCSKYPNGKYSIVNFENADGNIRYRKSIKHTWQGGKCIYCGASQEQYDRGDELESHAYEFIHTINPEKLLNMKFDVIIGNPPFSLSDGGSGPSASPIFDKFVMAAKILNPRFITMIIPSRWFAGGKGLDDFRENMINDDRLKIIVDYVNSADCFTGVDIAGGVNYFLWSRDYHGLCEITTIRGKHTSTAKRALNQFDILIRTNESISIINKVIAKTKNTLNLYVFTRNPFGFESKSRGSIESSKNCDIKLFHSQGIGFVGYEDVLKNSAFIDKWKVSIGKLVPSNGEVGVDPAKGYNVTTQPRILPPHSVITDSYLVLATFDSSIEVVNFAKYMTLKFTRFLIHETYSSLNISKTNFRFVPFMDYKKAWSDEELYKLFNLDDFEISFIETMIRTMNYEGEKYE